MTTADEIEETIKGALDKIGPGFVVDPSRLQHLARNKKCMMCKHTKDEAHIRPGSGYNPSPAWLHHYSDTHGQPIDIFASWLFLFPYINKDTGESALMKAWGGLLNDHTNDKGGDE